MFKDLLSGIVIVCAAGAYYLASRSIQVSSLEDEFGPHGLPNILAVALGCIGFLLAAKGALAVRKARGIAAVPATSDNRPWRAAGLLAIGFGYILLVDKLGYPVTLALLIAAVAWYEGTKPGWRMAAIAVGGAAVFWLLFVWLLDVAQPTGRFF